MTRTPQRPTNPVPGRRDPIVLNRSPERPLMVSWARIKFERRMARRAAFRRAWRVMSAVIVGIVGGLAMYAMAAAGLVPLLESRGATTAPPAAVGSPTP